MTPVQLLHNARTVMQNQLSNQFGEQLWGDMWNVVLHAPYRLTWLPVGAPILEALKRMEGNEHA